MTTGPGPTPVPPCATVVIAAHDEATVIARCLRQVVLAAYVRPIQVVVVTNGCSDRTADVARTFAGVEVVELVTASKTAALRVGDRLARAYPRVYLDADVTLPAESLLTVLDRLAAGPALAARPPVRYETAPASRLVRRYYRARSRMPSVMNSLWGAGVYALSEAGRRRFAEFPDLTGDDLFVDRFFDDDEIEIVHAPPVVVEVPRTARDLVRTLRRAQRGRRAEAAHSRALASGVGADLRRHARRGVRPALEAVTYAGFAAAARRPPATAQDGGWERDDSSRGL